MLDKIIRIYYIKTIRINSMSQSMSLSDLETDEYLGFKTYLFPQEKLFGEESDGFCLDLSIVFIEKIKKNLNLKIIFDELTSESKKMTPQPDDCNDESDVLEQKFGFAPPCMSTKSVDDIVNYINGSGFCGILVIDIEEDGSVDRHAIAIVGTTITQNEFAYIYDPNVGVAVLNPKILSGAITGLINIYNAFSMTFYDLL